MTPPPAFDIDDLGHRYAAGADTLRGVTAVLPAGATVVLLGPSGCGKSTLLNVLSRLWDGGGTRGAVAYHDGDQARDLLAAATDPADLRAGHFGVVLQSGYLLPHFTCLENVLLPLTLLGVPWADAEAEAERLLAHLGIDARGDLRTRLRMMPRDVSQGQRQRFAVLRAVIANPRVLFADEPSSNLDAGATAAMFEMIHLWRSGALFPKAATRPRTLVLVCHDVAIARGQATHVLLFDLADADGTRSNLVAAFPRSAWDQHAAQVEAVLKLPPGGAGRDGQPPASPPPPGPTSEGERPPGLAGRRLRWAVRYTTRDLYEALARPTSRAIARAVFLATVVAALALPLPWVTESVRLGRLRKSPWARCVWVTPPFRGKPLTDERLDALRAALAAAPGGTGRPFDVSGYHELTDRDYGFPPPGQLDVPAEPAFGRTVAANDQLVPALPDLIVGHPPAAFAGGVVVSPRLLRSLGHDPADPPAALTLRSLATGLNKTAAVWVAREEFPEGHQFLMFEADDQVWKASDARPAEVWSGSLNDTLWMTDPAAYDALRPDAEARGFVLSEIAQRDGETWRMYFQTVGGGSTFTWREWQKQLAWYAKAAEGVVAQDLAAKDLSGDAQAPQFRTGLGYDEAASPPAEGTPRKTPTNPYTHATIYVTELPDLRVAAAVACDANLITNDAARLLVDEIEATARRAKWVITAMVAGFCAAVFVALRLALFLRGRQKAAQIGMLRALGADRTTLRVLAVVEVFRLWLRGTAAGLTAAALAGVALAAGLGVSPAELAAATGWWVLLLFGFLGVSLGCCLVGNLQATRPARTFPPVMALGQTS